jgi:serine/threonine protein kinase
MIALESKHMRWMRGIFGNRDVAQDVPLRLGTTLSRYRIQKVLGRGGFGYTYQASDERLGGHVAIKEFFPRSMAVRAPDLSVRAARPSDRNDLAFGLREFITEARSLRRLSVPMPHPNVIAVYDFIEQFATGYMVMSFCEGHTLEALLSKHGSIPEGQLLAILGPLLDGLEHVHNAELIHRDIKPSNICISNNCSPVLIDFGTARSALGARTQTMTVVLTPGYAPVEQYSPKGHFGPPTDLYALGATLYHAVTGAPPLDSPGRVHDDQLPSARATARGNYSRSLLTAIDNLLRVRAVDRPQSVAEWRVSIETLLQPPKRPSSKSARSNDPSVNELVSKLNELYSSQEFLEGIALAKRAQSLHGESPLFLNSEGICLSDLGRYDEAIECFDRALRYAPRWVNLWANKGRALRALGRHGEALQCYDRAIECSPNEPTPWDNKGNCLLDLYRQEEARACFRRVTEIDPNYGNVQQKLRDLE